MQLSNSFTATGTFESAKPDVSSIISFAAVGTGGTNFVMRVEVQLVENGAWYTIVDPLVHNQIYTTNSGATGIRAVVTSMGTATSILFEANSTEGL